MEAITQTRLELPAFAKGKVRDTYELDNNLLMVSTDRLSAFDVVFKEGIPYKGQVLNGLSIFWFLKTSDIVKNHFITDAIPANLPEYVQKRAMIVSRAKPIALECIVRGYITGSAWKEYKESGKVCGIELPKGLGDGSELPHPIFTPSTKAKKGHDRNIMEEEARKIVGDFTYDFLKEKSLEMYHFAKNYAKKCGLVLADTKLEFGHYENGNGENGRRIILIDELLTPDSSRYWLKEEYDKGKLVSLDKQFVRDYLEKTGWNKSPPPPALPPDVIENTSKRYLQAYRMLMGRKLIEDNAEASSVQI
ncbi:MAG TPA: phosphoribosylaminoimidazolesuccinocarboxamide synthase [Candidatus Bilamarchaeaceae archaeon]|nr:phosphoribosylaminoimidazolesuccinocarboxamide synthase [Candidatus Bilamarchaeaceae archaeon]